MRATARYLALRNSLEKGEVSFGVGGLLLFEAAEVDARQVGYSVAPDGSSLCGGSGRWRPTWIVIGYETACGDPLFIDTSDPALPVFTAVHGEGMWNPVKIAVSAETFLESMKEFARIAVGRSNPVEQDQNPLSDDERNEFLARVTALNEGQIEAEFWDVLLTC